MEDLEEEEIDNSGKSLKKVYFIENPMVKLINDEKIANFFDETKRDNWVVKVSSVLSFYKEIFYEVKFNLGLEKRSFWIYKTLNFNYKRLEHFSYFIVLIINSMLMGSLLNSNINDYSNYYYAAMGMGILLIILNAAFMLVFMTSRYLFLVELELKKREKEEDFNRIWSKFRIYVLDTVLLNSTFLYMLVNTVVGIVGVILPQSTFAFALLLFNFTRFNKSASLLLKAFQEGLSQLIYMIFFLAILIWVYASVAFYFENSNYDNYALALGDPENICGNILHCFITFFNYGVRNGGGIGDIMPKITFTPTSNFVGRFLTDMLFFIVIVLLFLNMINGIIINTFSALREDLEIKTNDVENNCFICNLDKSTLGRKKIKFDDHFNKQHYIKDYLLFLIGVRLKKEIDLDPDETRVLESLTNNDVSFFPSEKMLDWDWTIVEKDET